MRWSTRTLLFIIYRLSYFHFIFVETAVDLTLDPATEEAKPLSVMAFLQTLAFIRRELLMVLNEQVI